MEKCEQWADSSHYEKTLKAVFGLPYLPGVFKSSHRHMQELWNTDGIRMDIYCCTTSQR